MSPLEMAAAYTTFATGGVYTKPYAYTKVLDSNGNVVLEHQANQHRVYREDTSFLMTSMLQDVITSGTAKNKVMPIENANGEKISVAGKTGTTDDNVDKWFCGYTPYYAAAVWYGYDNRLRQTLIPRVDKPNANRIWYYVMSKIHENLPAATFNRPDTVVEMEVCASGYYATDFCREAGTTVTDLFVVGSYLTPSQDSTCPIHTAPVEETQPQDPGITG